MNYNTLMNKPTINYRELIGDNTVTEVGGITEEQFNTLLTTDLSSYYTKAEIDDLFSRSYVYREKSGSIVTFDCPTNTNGIAEVTSEIVAVQSGTGDPSPTNVRPFSGWSEVNVYDTGKNLFNIDSEHTTSGATYLYNLKVKPNTTYTMSSNVPQEDVASLYFNGGSTNSNGVWEGQPRTFTSDADGNIIAYVRFYASSQGGIDLYTAVKNGTYYIQLEEGSFDTEYEPFGATYTTTLKDGQGNPMECYGGELSNVNGGQNLTADATENQKVKLSDLTWTYQSSDERFYCDTPITVKRPSSNTELPVYFGCECYKAVPYSSYTNGNITITSSGSMFVKDSNYTDTTTWLNAVGNNNILLPLATPQTIPQDSLSIASTAGVNNIWCDSGDITVKALDRIIQG